MPKTLFFDLDDTLLWDKKSIDTALGKTADDAAERYELDSGELVAQVRKVAPELYSRLSSYEFTKKIGINPFEGLWGEFGDAIHHGFRKMGEEVPGYQRLVWKTAINNLGVNGESDTFRDKFIEYRKASPFLYEETFDVLEELKQRKHRLVMVTNGAPSLQLEKLRITPELVPYFEHIVISGNVGEGKPEKAVFDHALRLTEEAPDNVLMIGDNLKTDILGANRSGIESVWIRHDPSASPQQDVDGQPTHTISRLKEIFSVL
ncbi:HAD family hydrolase [Jeotgalibacillus sp. R-1-5s-1]|nr:HAD family hydrolase [Jeotgalibacillus sp. R-1-5s-1]TFE02493.1 HAD family hydrolase [Jeotgalibacillus sp. R-1-5s-1]